MKIKIDELQKITTILLSKLKERKGNEVEIESDFYWDISSTQLYKPYSDPSDISLGQISDDIKEVRRLLNSEDESIPYDLKRIAEIIKVLGIENPIAF